ncbi:hypothetical protein [Nonomuraea sp. NPDC049625]|uniref:hypothetical protein n=1 Tax=Nonomuraea sp. NPDC049625 TaxID=3155775 RepID=UPI00343F4A76
MRDRSSSYLHDRLARMIGHHVARIVEHPEQGLALVGLGPGERKDSAAAASWSRRGRRSAGSRCSPTPTGTSSAY